MTDTASFTDLSPISRDKTASIPLPAPVPFGAPVLISDCVNPLAGETLLSLLWKRMDPEADLQS
jgi:hypothetical protein